MIHGGFSSQYQGFSRNTIRNRILKKFEDIKSELFNIFKDFNKRVCLTSDMWSNNDLEYQRISTLYLDYD